MPVGTNVSFAGVSGAKGTGVIATTLCLLPGCSTLTRASSRKVAAAARPSPSPNQFTRKLRRLGNTPAVAVLPDTSARACSIRAASLGEAPRGRSFFSSASSSLKSLMADKILFQRRQGIAVAGGRRVLGNCERLADFRESELVPDLHDEYLSLFNWQPIDCGSQFVLGAIIEIKLRLSGLLHPESCVRFPASATRIAPEKIERDRADGSEKQTAIVD